MKIFSVSDLFGCGSSTLGSYWLQNKRIFNSARNHGADSFFVATIANSREEKIICSRPRADLAEIETILYRLPDRYLLLCFLLSFAGQAGSNELGSQLADHLEEARLIRTT